MFCIQRHLSKPSLCVDGQTVAPILYALSDIPAASSASAQAQRNIAAFHEAGIDLVTLDIKLYIGWHKARPFDPAFAIGEIANALEANPHAKLLLRVHVNPPYWWMRDNPQECAVYRTEEGDLPGIDDGEYERLIQYDGDRHLRPSLASEKWLKDAGDVLVLLCHALEQTPEGQSVMGIQPACGLYGEWHQWGTDVSQPMQKRFKRFLREKYVSDEALKKAWNDERVTIETAPFHPEVFRDGDVGTFRDPKRSRFVMDAQECFQSVSPDAILYFCKLVKKTVPRLLTGAFYGYYLGTNGNMATINGHLQIQRLFGAQDAVDFMCGPFCYMKNRDADGVPMQRALLEAFRLRGMLWLTEMDQRPEGINMLGAGDPKKMSATIASIRRNALQVLCAGQGMWYFDHRAIPPASHPMPSLTLYRKRGWWEEKELMQEIKAIQSFAQKRADQPYTAAADVLLVYGADSYYCRARVEDYEYRIHEAVARCGVAYDCIYAEELELAELSRYRCVIFVNVYQITPEKRAMYRRLLADTKTLWLYAEGFCDGDSLSVENLSRTIGMPARRTQNANAIYVHARQGELALSEEVIPITQAVNALFFDGVSDGRPELSSFAFDPLFCIEKSDGIMELAHYDNGDIAAAVCGNDIWLGLPLPTRQLMESIFRFSGVHMYLDSGDPIMAGAGVVAVNCPAGGERIIHLRNGQSVTLSLAPYTTAVLDAESGQRLL